MSVHPDRAEIIAALNRCLEAYQGLLELAEEQERILAEGRIADLPSLLLQKAELVERARSLLARVRDAPPEEKTRRAFRSGMEALRTLMARLVEIEERCIRAAEPRGTVNPRAQAVAAYRAQAPRPPAAMSDQRSKAPR